MNRRLWLPGEPTPDFHARAGDNPRYTFHTTAGRYVILSFLGSASQADSAKVVSHINSRRHWFDDERLCFFGVSVDPADEAEGRLRDQIPGIRHFWDFDGKVSRLFGATERGTYAPFTLVLDPMLRVIAHIAVIPAEPHNQTLDDVLASLPPVADHAGTTMSAPVLIMPRVFEPELCRHLIKLYQQHGGVDSGFMREVNGKTVGVIEHSFKRRQDFEFDRRPELAELRQVIQQRLVKRLVPQIRRAFQFDATRMERYIVARYDGASGGYFRPHKDNTTPGTAHRRFACTINLNAEEYEGGELRFPEFGPRTYRAPTGGAVVFSCSLLHEATPVTSGERYAFLPFFYDEAAARQRQDNAQSLTGQIFDRTKGENEYGESP